MQRASNCLLLLCIELRFQLLYSNRCFDQNEEGSWHFFLQIVLAQFAELFVIYRKVCTAATVMVLILNSWADSAGAVCPIRCSSGFVGGSRRESAPFSSLSSGFSISVRCWKVTWALPLDCWNLELNFRIHRYRGKHRSWHAVTFNRSTI